MHKKYLVREISPDLQARKNRFWSISLDEIGHSLQREDLKIGLRSLAPRSKLNLGYVSICAVRSREIKLKDKGLVPDIKKLKKKERIPPEQKKEKAVIDGWILF